MRREHIESVRTFDGLCRLAEELGYKGPWGQLQCENGAFVTSLIDFLEDNPGAIEAITGWIADHGYYREGTPAVDLEHEDDLCDDHVGDDEGEEKEP